jgi:ribulose-5-phosphate 4-epimerase/fuculose-1-phosphate aldolase
MTLQEKMAASLWSAHALFDRQKVSGSSANLSFLHEGVLYISASGSCFGTLTEADFAQVALDSGAPLPSSKKPSKELPLHRMLYLAKPETGAVVHTHSFYSTLWSCLPHPDETDVLPAYTPYLRMKLGTVGLIPYAPPGSEALFAAFARRIARSDGYLLANHGPVVGGRDPMDAFYILEELEDSAQIAWHLRGSDAKLI